GRRRVTSSSGSIASQLATCSSRTSGECSVMPTTPTLGGGLRVPEQLAQRRTAPGDAGAHGSGRKLEDGCDLGVVEVEQVAQDDGDAELLRYRRERSIDVEASADALVEHRRDGS